MPKIFIYFLILLFCSCKKTLSEKERNNIFEFKEMSDLATVEYTISKLVKANDNSTWYKIGDRKIIMSVTAYLKAGIDLSKVQEENLSYTNKTVKITLPPAKLITLNIPPEEIKQEMTAIDALRNEFTNEEKNALLIQAENNIRHSIDSLGILAKAEENAKLFIGNFVKKLGYDNVEVTIQNK